MKRRSVAVFCSLAVAVLAALMTGCASDGSSGSSTPPAGHAGHHH